MTGQHFRFRPARASQLLAAAAVACLAGTALPAAAQKPGQAKQNQGQVLRKAPGVEAGERDLPVLFKADEMIYDEERAVVVATGNVEISRGDKIVVAERVTYDRNTRVVSAQGSVVLLEPGGNTLFADYMELSDDFREGVIEHIRMLLSDGSRMAGADAERTSGNQTVLRRAVYSPCELCKENPKKAPLWQVKAEKVTHDEAKKKVTYEDMTFELFGVPIMYAPTFSHPDPSVKRQSGFLAPTYGHDRNLGYTLRTPYYWSIAPERDVTITPFLMTEQGVILETDYRHLFQDGRIRVRANGGILDHDNTTETGDRTNTFRGSLRAQGDFDLSEIFRARFDLYRSSDDTYLRKFSYDSSATLRSRIQLEGFDDRKYLSLAAQTSQEQRRDVAQSDSPTAIPDLYATWQSHPSDSGDIFTLEGGALALLRTDGTQSRRVTTNTSWRRPWTSSGGHMFDLGASLRLDGYSVRNDPDPMGVPSTSDYDGFVGRVLPQATAGWRLPLVSSMGRGAVTVEPRVSVVLSPNSPNSSRIPNEDSQDSELDIDNLFRPNRFQGWDRVEGGQRVNYAVSAGYYGPELGRLTGAIGQSYRTSTENDFAAWSGLRSRLSDVVGGLELSPNEAIDFYYRFRLDKDSLKFARNEIGVSTGPSWLRLDLDYAQLAPGAVGGLVYDDREQINFRVRTYFSENWAAYVRSRLDLTEGEALISQAGLRYMDECFIIEGIYGRNYVYDRDVQRSNTFYLRVALRNFGESTDDRASNFGTRWRD